MGHSCRTLLWDTLVGHSCGTLLWDTLIGHSCGTLLTDTFVRHSCGTLLAGHSCGTLIRDTLVDSLVGHTLRACKTSVSYETSSKSTRQVSKTSVSYETPSKTHMSKSAKQAFRTRLPPKVKRNHPSEHTHHAALPSSFAIPAPPNNARSHANPSVTATFTSITAHNLTIPWACHESFRVHAHKVLLLPRNVASVTPRNLTTPCACHENRTSIPQNPHKALRLPRKLTISSHVSFNKIYTTPHVWNDFDPF